MDISHLNNHKPLLLNLIMTKKPTKKDNFHSITPTDKLAINGLIPYAYNHCNDFPIYGELEPRPRAKI